MAYIDKYVSVDPDNEIDVNNINIPNNNIARPSEGYKKTAKSMAYIVDVMTDNDVQLNNNDDN